MSLKNIQIRETKEADFNNIMEVEKQAFGYDKEAELVAQLLTDKSAQPLVSLLAFYAHNAIGHILFTKAHIKGKIGYPLIHILAPLAVKPDYQKQGIGGMLIVEGLKKIKEIGSEIVFVLGHKEYYPRYGFIPDAASSGFPPPYPIPSEHADAWMVQALTTKGLSKNKGKIVCANELDKPEHWRE
jgi:putative acetyltransferase